jgi:multiple sugar transport system substrate-binding protein
MSELELSIMSSTYPPDVLASALKEFEAREGIRVRMRVFSWDKGWAELMKVALYKTGPDISEVGTTWIDSLTMMDTLRPFTMGETASLGGPSVFLPSSWKSGSMLGGGQTWAVPWLSDTRLIYFRRDLFRQAGIDEQTAFETHEQLARTLHRLQENGVTAPWIMPTVQTLTALHNLASWVWGAGGHFISADGRHTRFSEPEARAGMRAYFDLHRYLAPSTRNLDDSQANLMFRQGKTATIISGQWLMNAIRHQDATPKVAANLGVALVPGVPYVGGSNLVIWRHSRHVNEAMELVRFLTSPQMQTSLFSQAGLLPARLDALTAAPFTTEQPFQVISTSLKTGRGFQAAYMWGLIEDGLIATLGMLWKAIFRNPELDIEQAVSERMEMLAQSLNHTLYERR